MTANALLGNNEIQTVTSSKLMKGKYAVLFVCPTELIAFEHRHDEFRKRNVAVAGVSIDSEHAHLAWKSTPESKGGVGAPQFHEEHGEA